MQQRQLRLGDIVDDYCPRERRITNHAVVAMVGPEIKQTRCTTCDAEHEYKQAKVPPQRKRKPAPGALYQEVLAGMPRKPMPVLTDLVEEPDPEPAAAADRVDSELGPMDVWGSGGRKLDDAWADGAEAHLGITVAGFPNLFLLYGPNTNLGHNSILVMVERQVEYVLRCLDALADRGARAIDVDPEVMATYNARVQDDLTRTVWAAACASWYKTAAGRITQNWPSFTVAYWRDTWRPRLRDFAFRR